MPTLSPVFIPEECSTSHVTQNIEKQDWTAVLCVKNIEENFVQQINTILNFVQSAEIWTKGEMLMGMLEELRYKSSFSCIFKNEYTHYSHRLETIKSEILEKYTGIVDYSIIYFKIIQKSLEYIASELKFDYIGIWKEVSDNQNNNSITPVHEIGNTTFIKKDALVAQLKIAKQNCSDKELIYNFPSNSQLGLVDIIYTFKNILGQPVGYLVIDDTKQKRTLNEREKIRIIIDYFYNELKYVIKEHELSLSIDHINRLQIQNMQLEEMSQHDSMTGLYNRKALLKIFNARLEDFNRLQIPLSVVMIDIDHFKKINDTYGHPIGDEVIKYIGDLLNGTTQTNFIPRNNDYFFRIGGEEFLGLLSNVTSTQAEVVCERIRQALQKHIFITPNGDKFSITASFGITQIAMTDVPKEYLKTEVFEVKIPDYTVQILTRADKALYNAKHWGRNCIKFFTEEA